MQMTEGHFITKVKINDKNILLLQAEFFLKLSDQVCITCIYLSNLVSCSKSKHLFQLPQAI